MSKGQEQRRLRLQRETIRTLSDDTLGQVAGGNGDSAGVLCLFSVLLVCGDSSLCSVLAGGCSGDAG